MEADNGLAEWTDGLVEVTLAMDTQKHSTINCTPAESLGRDRNTQFNWLNSQKRKNPTIGMFQEDRTQLPIFESDIEP